VTADIESKFPTRHVEVQHDIMRVTRV
jgi:hypothetical protein